MGLYNIVFSNKAPKGKYTLWAKPVEGGFTLYIRSKNCWEPFKVVDDKNTDSVADDVKQDLLGNGLDDWEEGKYTLRGLKNYIDEQIASLQDTQEPEETVETGGES